MIFLARLESSTETRAPGMAAFAEKRKPKFTHV